MKKNLFTIFLIFSYIYIIFYSIDVPIFFEGRLYLNELLTKDITYWMLTTFSPGSDNILNSNGEITGLFISIINLIFGYNENIYRLIKSIFFCISIVFIYTISKLIMGKKFAFLSTTVLLFSFPLFLHTFIFDEPFIYAELFKLASVFFIIKDIFEKKTINIFSILIFSFLSFRFYHPASSILGLILLTSIITKKSRYLFIFLTLLLFILPRNLSETKLGTSYHIKSNIINEFFIKGFFHTLLNPIPSFRSLYQGSFWKIITFSGIILILLTIGLGVWSKVSLNKFYVKFLFAWIITETPLFLFLPEYAVRYISGILTPFVLLNFFIINEIFKKEFNWKKQTYLIIVVLTIGIIIINLGYTTLFRATWGSGFIAADKVIKYLQDKKEPLTVYYQVMQVAPDFVPLNVRSKELNIDRSLNFIPYNELMKFNNNTYIVQRITSSSKKYPRYSNLSQIDAELIGINDNNLFDKIVMPVLEVIGIKPNKMIIYKLS